MQLPIGHVSEYERRLFDRVERLAQGLAWSDANAARLQEIAGREGTDVATALLYTCVRESDTHGHWVETLDRNADVPEKKMPPRNLIVGIVPGGCHEESTDSRECLRLVHNEIARRGFTVAILPLSSFGALSCQAKVINDWLFEHAMHEIILVSLSKGSSEVKLALRDDPKSFRPVSAWINVSGLLFGSEWVSWLLDRTISRWGARVWCRYWGYSYAVLEQLRREAGSVLDFDLCVPDHVSTFHIYGFPLSNRLSHPYTRRSFHRLASRGPNDGMGVMLGDLTRLSGLVYPVWGADHFLRLPGRDMRDFVGRVLYSLLLSEWSGKGRGRGDAC